MQENFIFIMIEFFTIDLVTLKMVLIKSKYLFNLLISCGIWFGQITLPKNLLNYSGEMLSPPPQRIFWWYLKHQLELLKEFLIPEFLTVKYVDGIPVWIILTQSRTTTPVCST